MLSHAHGPAGRHTNCTAVCLQAAQATCAPLPTAAPTAAVPPSLVSVCASTASPACCATWPQVQTSAPARTAARMAPAAPPTASVCAPTALLAPPARSPLVSRRERSSGVDGFETAAHRKKTFDASVPRSSFSHLTANRLSCPAADGGCTHHSHFSPRYCCRPMRRQKLWHWHVLCRAVRVQRRLHRRLV